MFSFMHSSSGYKVLFNFLYNVISFTEVAVVVLQDADVDYTTVLLNILKGKSSLKEYAYHLSNIYSIPPSHLIVAFHLL